MRFSNQFRMFCLLRILFLTGSLLLLLYLIYETSLYSLMLVLGIGTIYQVYALILYVEKTNHDLLRFLDAIKYEDFSQTFRIRSLGSSFDELRASFNEILEKFQRTRAEKEEHYRYLQTVVQHVGIGLISYRQDGEVQLINQAAKRLFKILRLKNIRSLKSFSPGLVHALQNLKAGEKILVKIEDKDDLLQLVIYSTEFILQDQKFTLVSIQNIQSELEEKEMEAWQNLIRVLTHEIMNSVTPIASMASTAHGLLKIPKPKKKQDAIPDETLEDVRGAVQTIQKRSEGLLHFVESYRKLTRLPRPDFKIFLLSEMFQRVETLMASRISDKIITFRISIDPPSLELTADSGLVEQVLINLLVNAIQAVESMSHPQISMTGSMDARGRIQIQVCDNGPGILEEVQEKIFIPFFTTKKEGSGIGLSLSRQIMRLHRGKISVQSTPGKTTFTLRF